MLIDILFGCLLFMAIVTFVKLLHGSYWEYKYNKINYPKVDYYLELLKVIRERDEKHTGESAKAVETLCNELGIKLESELENE